MQERILFKETQTFTQWWLWVILFFSFGLVVYKVVSPMLVPVKDASGNSSIAITAPFHLWFGILLTILIVLFFTFSKLTVKVFQEKITIRHLIFYKRTIAIKDINTIQKITYGFVGYGIRWSLNYGTVYNVKGNCGLLIRLENGKKCLIGSQRLEEFARSLKEIMP